MVAYLVCFGLSLFFLYGSDKIGNKFLSGTVVFIALLFPCILAGLRSLQVGTDLLVYVNPMFKLAMISKSWKEYNSLYWVVNYLPRYVNNIEIGFSLLVYVIAKVTSNFHVLLFIIQCLIIFPTYFGFKKILDDRRKICLAMLFFYFMLYNVSLNIVRQFIGMAFAFLGLSYSVCGEEKNIFKTFFYVLIGLLFHKSIVISIMIFGIYWLIEKSDSIVIKALSYRVSIKSILTVLIIILSIFSVFKINQIISVLNIFNVAEYSGYIKSEFNVTALIPKIITVLPVLGIMLLKNKELKKIENNSFYLTSFFIYFASLLLSGVSEFASRIGYIFQFFNCIYFVLLCSTMKKRTIHLIVILYIFVYWWFFFIHLGYNHTVPYYFFWEGS